MARFFSRGRERVSRRPQAHSCPRAVLSEAPISENELVAGTDEGQRRSVRETVERAPASPRVGKLPDPRCSPWKKGEFLAANTGGIWAES